jgi:acetylserotonin N-methyltransferase
MPQQAPSADPTVVLDLIECFRRSKTMFAAVALGVFDAVEASPMSASALATSLGVDQGALERLLDACVGLQLLTRAGEIYANTRASSVYLCKQSPARMTGYINYSNAVLWKMWGNLEDAIREGTNRWQQTFGWDGPIFAHFFRTEEAMREFLMAMHGYGLISSPHVVAAFDLSRFRRLVDLGGATGHLAIAACRHYPAMTAVVFDLPETGGLAREIIGASPVADRIEVVAGDFFKDTLPAGDLYALGRVVHDWAEPKVLSLLHRILDRLPSGGGVLIAEKLIDEDRAGPRWAQMQNLGMLIYTEGKERTFSEYQALLRQVGFAEVHATVTPSPLDAVLAIKE